MLREYELTVVVRTLPSDEEVNQAIDQVIAYVEQDDNGKVKGVDRKTFGRRRLAYANQWSTRGTLCYPQCRNCTRSHQRTRNRTQAI